MKATMLISISTICPASNLSFSSLSSVDAYFLAISQFVRGKWGLCHIFADLPLRLPLSQFEGEK